MQDVMQNRNWMTTGARACTMLLLLTAGLARSAPVEQAWEQIYNGEHNDGIGGMALDGDENIYVTGYSANASNHWELATIKYSPDGTPLWLRRHSEGPQDSAGPVGIAVNAVGEAWVIALSAGPTSAAYLTIKYDADGTELWARRLEGANQWGTQPRAFAVDAFGNAFVTGLRRVSDVVDAVTTVKYSPSGDELWVRVANDIYWPTALAVDGNGSVILP